LASGADVKTGLVESNAGVGGAFGSAISSISIDTQANAQKAIKVIDNALTTISDVRSDLGAINNRLDFTISNLANISEKTSSARSRITDADFAAETANLSRSQVLQQAASAMLAQSNARPQQVLSLLR
jgi:flagellin